MIRRATEVLRKGLFLVCLVGDDLKADALFGFFCFGLGGSVQLCKPLDLNRERQDVQQEADFGYRLAELD